MELKILKAKIHTVKVTEANVSYNGSITIDADLLDAAGIVKYEQVYINNAVNGSRIMTYVLPGKRGSGEVCMNGGAALHAKVGDTVHILSFVNLSPEEAETYQPTLVFTEGNNQIKSVEKYNY
ncbi:MULTISPECIES: aspartate 1-decarboxylase [Sphingobacterium]|uniref:Aspartate 1-decarboxylase n=1 Tax=Sphingobacterium cellulitidis TaxID=1768011 RepID=A0A8H9G585_9SPHI|nr:MULTISPECIES: aspartate 1-decarboxylase [Sphingobacterium]MBA8988752.1 aspartate 1-decarboxylase [Sphingobacterium soli]OYD42390.1 aspartate 1-decarboxylase [Sphingobacterium cellulitidis]OYD45223.1 aspartate 1-decarboxylase [Sphingobacterium cellulitidis]WFB65222.1 aspartate 1-decarboxylase [Sphingobacterium sp. WM]GGE35952.1 aspartate 1-decarboxylase [Sphingobacterium soli]